MRAPSTHVPLVRRPPSRLRRRCRWSACRRRHRLVMSPQHPAAWGQAAKGAHTAMSQESGGCWHGWQETLLASQSCTPPSFMNFHELPPTHLRQVVLAGGGAAASLASAGARLLSRRQVESGGPWKPEKGLKGDIACSREAAGFRGGGERVAGRVQGRWGACRKQGDSGQAADGHSSWRGAHRRREKGRSLAAKRSWWWRRKSPWWSGGSRWREARSCSKWRGEKSL